MVHHKLLPYVQRAASLEGQALVDLVHEVLSAPGIYQFADLLALPSIEKLSFTHPAEHKLLQIFAYGTLQDYTSHPSPSLPDLTPPQLHKLRLLTLLHLVSVSPSGTLPYADLHTALALEEVRAMEDLVMDGVYANVLKATLDQRRCEVQVGWCLGRDVHPGQVGALAGALRACAANIQAVLDHMDLAFHNVQKVAHQYKVASEKKKQQQKRLVARNNGKRPASMNEFTAA